MYELPPQEEPAGCRDAWVLTRAAFAVLLPLLAALIGVLAVVFAALLLFAMHPALALAPIAALAVAVYLFARWEQRRFRPPDI